MRFYVKECGSRSDKTDSRHFLGRLRVVWNKPKNDASSQIRPVGSECTTIHTRPDNTMFRFFLPLALASTAASMTVFPGIMSESEAELYLEQAASAPGSLRNGKFVTVDAVVAKKIQTALRGRRLLDEKDGSSVWEAPVSSYPRNPLTSNIKVSRRLLPSRSPHNPVLTAWSALFERVL